MDDQVHEEEEYICIGLKNGPTRTNTSSPISLANTATGNPSTPFNLNVQYVHLFVVHVLIAVCFKVTLLHYNSLCNATCFQTLFVFAIITQHL